MNYSAMLTDKWNKYLTLFEPSQKDIYFTEQYLDLYKKGNESPLCFIFQEDSKCFLFPFLRRTFEFNKKSYFDFETAYGYGGPISNAKNPDFIERALSAFIGYCKDNNFVAGFIRFHPLLDNQKFFHDYIQIIPDRHTVAINLKQSIDQIWMNEIHTKNRNVIKKAIKNGLNFIADYEYNYMDEFIRLYHQTMDKLDASEFYYFDREYYLKFKNNFPNSFLGVIKKDDSVISCAIFMYDGPYGHYHLSGSDINSLNLSPNNLLLWGAAQELKAKGVHLFHLGGGINSDEHNSLLEFKKKFSKSLYQFALGKIIFNEAIYKELCREWESTHIDIAEKYKHILLKYKY